MKKNLFFNVLLVFYLFCGPALAGWEPLAELKASDPCEDAQFGYSISIDNGIAAIGAPGRNNNQGAVYVYDINGLNNWNYITTLLPPDLNDTDQFGYSICIDSNKLVAGTYTAEEVYVFDCNGTEWDTNPELLSVVSSDYGFGRTVSMDGNTIVVGALGNNNQTGAAYVFDYNGVEWNYTQELTDPCGVIDDDFGCSIAIDGNVIVVGAESDDADSDVHTDYDQGSVSIFRYNGSTWIFEKKFKYPDIYDWAYLGHSVSIAGDTIVAGAYQHSEGGYLRAGAVYVYKWNGSSWEQNAILFDPNPESMDKFGTAVATDGNTIIVGNEYHDGVGSNSGAAYLFEWNGDSWPEGQILENPSGTASDYFGCSVALDGDMILAGAQWDDGGENNAGAVHVFLFPVADLNQDGIVNFEDFAILANQWLQIPDNPSADIAPASGGDNFVNTLDLKVLVNLWLQIGSPYTPSQVKYSGGTGEPENPYRIANPADLDSLASNPNDWDKSFILTADIDMQAYTYSAALIAPDTGSDYDFQGSEFTGTFDGNKLNILNINIDAAGQDNNYLGLFGRIGETGEVRKLGVKLCNISGGDYSRYIGAIAGENRGNIQNSHASGYLYGDEYIGGLCGKNISSVSDSSSNCYVSGGIYSGRLGGLCGYNYNGDITNSYATGDVTAGYNAQKLAGLCGYNYNGNITKSYATGDVTGGYNAQKLGGLCGSNDNGSITNSYAKGNVSGEDDSYDLGGCCGYSNTSSQGNIANSYAAGSVTAGNNSIYLGGFCGRNYGSINNCYFLHPDDGGGPDNGFGTALTEEMMKIQSSFEGWNFTEIWSICEYTNYPKLLWQIKHQDYLCPDGVDFIDYSFFANHWLLADCNGVNDCRGTDLDGSGKVDIRDLDIFVSSWLSGK